jgi:hypothetical protein
VTGLVDIVYLQLLAGHPDRAFGKRSAGVVGCGNNSGKDHALVI